MATKSYSNVDRPVSLIEFVTDNGDGTAGSTFRTREANSIPKGYQQITNAQLATVQGLSAPSGSKYAKIQNNGAQPLRYRDDGVTPTAMQGMRLAAGDELPYYGDLTALKLIREADGVTVDIAYYA